MEQREETSSFDLSGPAHHCTHILHLPEERMAQHDQRALLHSSRAFTTSSFRLGHAGSISRKAGGASSGVMRLPGQRFATPTEIEQATRVATAQLNLRAKPWVWGRPPKTRRLAIVVASFPIAFEEWSTSISKW